MKFPLPSLRYLAKSVSRSKSVASELRRFRNLTREARASTNSYLTAVIESQETDEAGRLFCKRIRREKAED